MTDTSGKDVNMKRFTFIAIVVLVELLSQPGQAADWTAYGLVCDNQVDLWAAKAVSERVKVGGYASWIDNDGAPEGDGLAAGLVATYDLLNDGNIVVGDITVPVDWFIGAKAGVAYWSGTDDIDPSPGLLTGFVIGDAAGGIAVVYEHALTADLWQVLAPRADKDVLMIGAFLRL